MIEFQESKRFTEEGNAKTAFVDIDETICFYSGIRRYDLAEPNFDNIKKINKLFEEGWIVVYWTARGSTSGLDYTEFTLKQLVDWGCKFNYLKCGGEHKPHFDLVIDDKAKRIEEL